ncbi:hypothetical protein BC829DRAFT_443500 [Chytridium lagenaria]|nr:hypothetical protein BC829DRAFT_443500 [Chytridium lagenaria]
MPSSAAFKRFFPLLVVAGFIAILIAVVSTVGVLNGREGQRKKNTAFNTIEDSTIFPPSRNLSKTLDEYFDNDYNGHPCAEYSFISISASVMNLDVVNGIYKLNLAFTPCGDFVDTRRPVIGRSPVLGTPVSISFDTKVYNFSAGVPMASHDFVDAFVSGDINNYPFDKYVASELYAEGEFFNRTANRTNSISLALFFTTPVLTWTVRPDAVKDISPEVLNGQIVQLDFNVARSATTIFFSGLIMVIMWVLSLLAFTLASTLWMKNRKVEPPTIAFSIALMFALPGIRNIQPGSPPIGCTSDVVSFFWAMVLAAVTASLLMVNYILKWNFEAPPAAPAAPAPLPKKMEEQAPLPQEASTRTLA